MVGRTIEGWDMVQWVKGLLDKDKDPCLHLWHAPKSPILGRESQDRWIPRTQWTTGSMKDILCLQVQNREQAREILSGC